MKRKALTVDEIRGYIEKYNSASDHKERLAAIELEPKKPAFYIVERMTLPLMEMAS